MKKIIPLVIVAFLLSTQCYCQDKKFSIFNKIIGEWHGEGSGFGNNNSRIESSFTYVMDSMYIKVINESWFEPTEKNPEGEHHVDWGIISYDKSRDKIVFRQFHIEGFVNQYILNETSSSEGNLLFESESIENLPNGKARWNIFIKNENAFESIFDVAFDGENYTCFGINKLNRK